MTDDLRPIDPEALIRVAKVARLCDTSEKSIRRKADAGLMPAPMKIGGILRWRKSDILQWIEEGCTPVRSITKEGAIR